MAVERREQPLRVEIPRDDGPRLGRVGVIAMVGFGIGALWPTLAGVKLVPNAPTQSTPSPDLGGEPATSAAPEVPPSAAPATSQSPATAPAPSWPRVGEMQVTSCRGKDKKVSGGCGELGFDRVARPHLERLSTCEESAQASGVLSLGFDLDFGKGRIERIGSGKSTSLEEKQANALVECMKTEFAGVTLDGVQHEHEKYAVFYRVEVKGLDDATPEETPRSDVGVTPASGRATVAWDVALVRAAPSRDDQVVARILSGTRVVVTGRSGDWYQIKFDAKGTPGWVYRTAIGM